MLSTPTLTLTKDQTFCLTYAESPHFLISGVAGSGKSLVLLRRACRFAQEGTASPNQVLVFTYNKTLATYARALIAQNAMSDRVEVTNFHRWAWRALPASAASRSALKDGERLLFVRRALDDSGHTLETPFLHTLPLSWWSDEFRWIKGRGILDLAEYQRVERAGRGRQVTLHSATHRPQVWRVFEAFEQRLRAAARIEFDDYARELLRLDAAQRASLARDHVLIDEIQDLSGGDLRLLSQLARRTLTVVEDRGQQLYSRSYDLKDVGIEVAPFTDAQSRLRFRSRRLKVSYRSTYEIAHLAESLRQQDTSLTQDERAYELPAPTTAGQTPTLYAARDPREEEAAATHWALEGWRRDPTGTIALVARYSETLERLATRLAPQAPTEIVRDHRGSPLTPGIKLLTAHSCKGLEFDRVALLHVNEGTFPLAFPEPAGDIPQRNTAHERQEQQQALGNDDADLAAARAEHFNRERRLVYVPISRARRELLITATRGRLSRFLAELDPQLYTLTLSSSSQQPVTE